MTYPWIPGWLKRALLDVAYRPHERISTYAPAADQDRKQMLAAAKANGQVIEQLFWAHTGRLAHKWPHYFAVYERLFARFRDGFTPAGEALRPLRFLEIGVSHGGSLELWRKYFGPDAILFGIDIDPRCAIANSRDHQVRIGSQADPEFIRSVVAEMGGVDIVLDDGSHVAEHQRASLDILMPLLSEGGLYVVEDTQTAYWRAWQGGYRKSGSFIEVAKSIVDDMHARYHTAGANRTFAAAEIYSTSFYDGMVVFEKAARPRSYTVEVGTPSFD